MAKRMAFPVLLALLLTVRGARRLLDRTERSAPGTTWPRALVRQVVPGFVLGYAAAGLLAWLLTLAFPGMLVVPQNSPELRAYDGYLGAIDGIGMEELFFLAHDEPCARSWCRENLANTRALRAAGKAVLAVDYATSAANVRTACDRYAVEGFAGAVTTRALDVINPPCG